VVNISQSEAPVSGAWKRPFIVSAGLGAGAAAVVLAVAVATVWYTTRPARARPWDPGAVDARFSGMSLTTSQPLVMTFSYTVENHTGRDYELPPSSSIYKALAAGKGLRQDSTLKWDAARSAMLRDKCAGPRVRARIGFMSTLPTFVSLPSL
jgi:hypothetical protein